MAGIYIHIPFCKQACHYCDFHFSTLLKAKKDFLVAIKKEIFLQKEYLKTKNINTVYFGGGTPSLLSKEEVFEIWNEIEKYFSVGADAEITLEANPDDLSIEKLAELSQTPINRLSIGIQSFSDADLKLLNRVHTSKEAFDSVNNAKDAGFKNITIDLMYGIHTLTNERWKQNLEKVFSFDVQHVSCYSLTVEPRTALHSFIQKGQLENIDVKKSAEQFEILMEYMAKNKFIHYEISNFCKEGFYSRHNSSYWKGHSYLGLGPSAHSYDGCSRQWNVRNNSSYINSTNNNILLYEREELTEVQKFNEYILTALRTIWGVDLIHVQKFFSDAVVAHLTREISAFIENKMIFREGEKLFLTNKGKLYADSITSNLFFPVK